MFYIGVQKGLNEVFPYRTIEKLNVSFVTTIFKPGFRKFLRKERQDRGTKRVPDCVGRSHTLAVYQWLFALLLQRRCNNTHRRVNPLLVLFLFTASKQTEAENVYPTPCRAFEIRSLQLGHLRVSFPLKSLCHRPNIMRIRRAQRHTLALVSPLLHFAHSLY